MKPRTVVPADRVGLCVPLNVVEQDPLHRLRGIDAPVENESAVPDHAAGEVLGVCKDYPLQEPPVRQSGHIGDTGKDRKHCPAGLFRVAVGQRPDTRCIEFGGGYHPCREFTPCLSLHASSICCTRGNSERSVCGRKQLDV